MELVVFFALKSLYPKISHQKASYLVELVDFSQDAVFLAPIGALVHLAYILWYTSLSAAKV